MRAQVPWREIRFAFPRCRSWWGSLGFLAFLRFSNHQQALAQYRRVLFEDRGQLPFLLDRFLAEVADAHLALVAFRRHVHAMLGIALVHAFQQRGIRLLLL